MITAFTYFIGSIVVGIFAYKCYSIGYGKKLKNSFANYLFISTSLISLSMLKSAILIPIAYYTKNNDLLFWSDFIGRAMYYLVAVFTVQIPLYKFYLNDKRRFIFSVIYAIVGIIMLIYQLTYRNQPFIQSNGLVDWNSNLALVIAIIYLLMLPWLVTAIIFVKEFIDSKFKSPKPLLIGLGFFSICIGGIFQDAFNEVYPFISFVIVLMLDYLFILSGLYYEE